MIRSVLTSLQSSTATRPRWVTKGSMSFPGRKGGACPDLLEHLAHVGEVPHNGRGRGHGRADQVGATAGPLAALEVAVARARRPLAGRELVGVHRQAHAAARLPPLG